MWLPCTPGTATASALTIASTRDPPSMNRPRGQPPPAEERPGTAMAWSPNPTLYIRLVRLALGAHDRAPAPMRRFNAFVSDHRALKHLMKKLSAFRPSLVLATQRFVPDSLKLRTARFEHAHQRSAELSHIDHAIKLSPLFVDLGGRARSGVQQCSKTICTDIQWESSRHQHLQIRQSSGEVAATCS